MPIPIVAGLWLKKINPSQVISFVLFLVLPAILPFIRRAGPPTLVATGLFAAFVLWRQDRLGTALKAHLRNPVTLLFLAFMAWATISLAWSTVPYRGFVNIATSFILVAAFLMILEFPLAQAAPAFLMAGLSIGSGVIAVDFLSGSHLLKFLHTTDAEPWRYNMVVVSYSVLGMALLTYLNVLKLFTFMTVFMLVALATFLGESETAKLLLILFPVLFSVCLMTPRSVIKSAYMCVSAFVVLFSSAGMPGLIILKKLVPPEFWRHGSGDERLAIWSSVADFAYHGLPFGWGVATTASPYKTSYFIAANQDVQRAISHWHPHNNFLQIATELGLPGFVIGLSLLAIALVKSFPASRFQAAAFVTFVSVILGMASISHGFWQSWWWTAVLIAWYAIAKGNLTNDKPSR